MNLLNFFQQKYQVHVDVTTLILMDLHAHSSLSEVMGLIGGIWNVHDKSLMITHYEPCRNVASSATHCDMCPVSQAKAADAIHDRGLEILGWFHSHPTFAPEPSQQDLDTQLTLQQWIGTSRPCVGVILSPFNVQGALIASPFRCMVLEKEEGRFLPFRFKVDVTSSSLSVDKLLKCSEKIFGFVGDAGGVFRKEYFLDRSISYLDKVSGVGCLVRFVFGVCSWFYLLVVMLFKMSDEMFVCWGFSKGKKMFSNYGRVSLMVLFRLFGLRLG